jgi:hypothetical protein
VANASPFKIAVVWRGDADARRNATSRNNRFFRVFEELAAIGVDAQPVVFDEGFANDVRAELLAADGVLVWVDPLHDGKDRTILDALLRDVAAQGPWVSAHPDTVLKVGTKEVLYRTRHMGCGTDTHLYRTTMDFDAEFPTRLRSAGPRVLKQNRGNGGQGVWKVEAVSGPDADAVVRVLEARRGSLPEDLSLAAFVARCRGYFAGGGCIIDQPFQPRLPDGMIRCYVGVDRVVGFGHQLIKALIPPPPEGPDSPAAQPGPRIMHDASAEPFRMLRALMETEWVPQMMQTLGLDRTAMPIIWDADFLYGPRTASGEDTYVLCEINVSSVFAIPDQAPAAIARLVQERMMARKS